MRKTRLGLWLLLPSLVAAPACSNDEPDAQTPSERATLAVKGYLQVELDKLVDASARLQKAAPEPDDDGWSLSADRAAVEKMRMIWAETRDTYERTEGALAELFPDLDESTDQRYDWFIETLGPDTNLFDDETVTGMHAIERILWADSHPPHVIAFESALVGYQAAAFPSTREQADDFKNKLTARLVRDTTKMRDDTTSQGLALDPETAFGGVVGSMEEQFEKVNLAATAGDESRYAKHTLDDMRANLEGGRQIYRAFSAWVIETSGAELDKSIQDGFARLEKAYDAIEGGAIPEVPENFSATKPSEEHLQTPYGKLFQLLTDEGDGERDGSLVNGMVRAGKAMGIDL